MFCDYNPAIEPRNYIDGRIFTRDDPCLWVVYPPGAAGDLLISIIDKHYLCTGCQYYGINDYGRVMLYTTDYEMIDVHLQNNPGITIQFDDQWFYDFSEKLSERNLTYSMLDQVIFGCHMWQPRAIQHILDNFTQAKIINIYPKDAMGQHIVSVMRDFKLAGKKVDRSVVESSQGTVFCSSVFNHDRVLNVPFGFLFNKDLYDRYYSKVRQFLGLKGALICHDFVEFYLSKQHEIITETLRTYSQNL